MTLPPPWTVIRSTPSSSPRQNVPRVGVIIHHAATTNFDLLRRLVMGQAGRQVSYTAIANRAELELIVSNDSRRPWSVANALWDSRMRSVCLTNQSVNGWTVAAETVASAARAVAFWAQQDGFWPHRDGPPSSWTVIGHGEVRTIHGAGYATACPGGTPLGEITRQAQQLLRPAPPTPAPEPEEEPTMQPRQMHARFASGLINRALIVPGTGYFVQWTEAGATFANGFAREWETGSSVEVTESLFNAIRRETLALRPPSAPAPVAVAISDPEAPTEIADADHPAGNAG